MEDRSGGEAVRGDRLAPVIPLFGGDAPAHRNSAPVTSGRARTPEADGSDLGSEGRSDEWHRSWIVAHSPSAESDPVDEVDSRGAVRDAAETALLKKLRSRSLSEREARAVLAVHELEPHEIEAVIEAFLGHGYLDDARLAEHLVHVATDRKAQGRQSVAQTLAARGIPREIVAATLAELPDDDAERALAFARQKARSMASLDRDTALRRLHGQLARRGFGGPTAMSAARQALDEAGARPSSVRFH